MCYCVCTRKRSELLLVQEINVLFHFSLDCFRMIFSTFCPSFLSLLLPTCQYQSFVFSLFPFLPTSHPLSMNSLFLPSLARCSWKSFTLREELHLSRPWRLGDPTGLKEPQIEEHFKHYSLRTSNPITLLRVCALPLMGRVGSRSTC